MHTHSNLDFQSIDTDAHSEDAHTRAHTVQSVNSLRVVRWMISSVSRSTLAVASSITSTLLFLVMARARQMSWR
jgi:hypothetical protein